MKISKPHIFQENKQIIYQVDVESIKGNETLWYSLHDDSFGDLLSTIRKRLMNIIEARLKY